MSGKLKLLNQMISSRESIFFIFIKSFSKFSHWYIVYLMICHMPIQEWFEPTKLEAQLLIQDLVNRNSLSTKLRRWNYFISNGKPKRKRTISLTNHDQLATIKQGNFQLKFSISNQQRQWDVIPHVHLSHFEIYLVMYIIQKISRLHHQLTSLWILQASLCAQVVSTLALKLCDPSHEALRYKERKSASINMHKTLWMQNQ